MVHIISSHKSYKAEYKYIRDACQQDRLKGVTHRACERRNGHRACRHGKGHQACKRGAGKGSGMGPGGKGAPPAKGSATGGANMGGPCGKGPGTGDSHALRLGEIAWPGPCNTH